MAGDTRFINHPVGINYRYGALSSMERVSMNTDAERAADRKEQDELLDEWYRTEECQYDKR